MEKIQLTPVKEIDNGGAILGFEYESKITLITALCAALNFDDFEIKTNVKGYIPLDDISLLVKQDGKDILYLFQIKHVNKTTKIQESSFFKESKPKFDLLRYCEKFIELSTTLNNTKIVFIFFTNSKMINSTLFIKYENDEMDFFNNLNTSHTVHGIYLLNKGHDKVKILNGCFSENSYFYMNQEHTNNIHKVITKLLQKFEISVELSEYIIDDLLNFVSNICKEAVNKPVITKRLILRIVYYSCMYCRSISFHKFKLTDSNVVYSLELWDYLKSSKVVINWKYFESIKNMIFRNISTDNNVFFNILFNHVKSVHINIVKYFVECCRGFLPFLIDVKYYDEILNILNQFSDFKIIFFTDNNKCSDSKFVSISRTLIRYIYNLEFVLEHRNKCSIRDVVDNEEELEQILINTNVSDLLEIYNLNQAPIITKNSVELDRHIYKIEVSEILFNDVNLDLKIILGCSYSNDHFKQVFKIPFPDKLILMDTEVSKYSSEIKIIISKLVDFKFDETSRNVHYLEFENNRLYWRGTIGGIKPSTFLKKADNKTVKLKEVFDYFKYNTLIVFSGVPGIGKSTAMKQLSKFIPLNIFVTLFNLREKQEILLNLKDDTHCLQVLKILCNDSNSYYLNLLELKLRKKQLLVILDGYDEIAPKFVSVTNKLIKLFLKDGIKVVLTTRSVLETQVEKDFLTKSIVLKPFEINEQREYLQKYFSQNTQLNYYDTKNMCENIISKIKNNLIGDVNFNSVPLHLTIISDILLDLLRINNFELSNIRIDKLKIYETFVEKKLDILTDKTKVLNIDEDEIREYHQNFAVKEIFSNNVFSNILLNSLDIFSGKLHRGSEKTGILIDDVNDIFIHRTIAEYFTALFLINNFESSNWCKSIIVNDILKKEYYVVNEFFNSLLYNTTSVYNKIIQNKFEEITGEEVDQIFKLDRNILHLLILNFDKNRKFKMISNKLGLFLKNIWEKKNNMLNKKDYFGFTPINYLEKLAETIENNLKITINITANNILFYFNQEFNLLHFLTCKNIVFVNDRPELKMDGGIDILTFVFEKHNSDNSFLFLIENFPSIKCSKECYLEGVLWLLESGEDSRNLHRIAMNINSLDISVDLLNKDRDFNWKDGDDNPLHYACKNNLLDFIQLFIKNGANFEHKNSKGQSCLDIISKSDNIEVLNLLLNMKENSKLIGLIILNNNQTYTNYLLYNKINSKELEMFNLLQISPEKLLIFKSFLKQSIYDENGNTMLHLIISDEKRKFSDNLSYNENVLSLFKNLIETKYDINIKNSEGFSPFQLAVLHKDFEMVKFLSKFGIFLNTFNNNQENLIHTAVNSNSPQIIYFLLKNQTIQKRINTSDISGNSPLIWAAQNQNLEIVIKLIQYGANVNQCNLKEETPLHWVSQFEITKFLLENGSDVNSQDLENNTPLMSAIGNNNLEIIKILVNFGAQVGMHNNKKETPLHWVVSKNLTEETIFLLEYGANIESLDVHGDTPLMWAITYRHIEVLKILIEFGANVTHTNKIGASSLHIAVSKNYKDIVSYLLKLKVQIDNLDVDGNSPLMWAVREKNLDMVELLFKSGADINIKNKKGEGPLHYSFKYNSLPIALFLLDNDNDNDDTNNCPFAFLESLAHEYNNFELYNSIMHECNTCFKRLIN